MSSTFREAAREAARLQWVADRYRLKGERNAQFKEHAERLAVKLEELAASTLCRGFERSTA
ncbi:MAG: hypothetical protein OEU92_04650 [Alphaproteobacteria bacterium]|nr:hypothetical protein [Alphaproteobacteria bacterium]